MLYCKTFNNLNDDVILILINFLDYFIDHKINFIKHKVLNLDLIILKKMQY